MNDEMYMRMALDLAEKARGRTSPNPMVGAVIVKDGEIVGKGYHKKAGTPHAEVHAINDAGDRAKGATMYVTLEPCSHYGRTPPCAEAIIKAGITKVRVGMVDPNPLVAGRGIKLLEEAGIEVKTGLIEEAAKRLNEVFIKYIRTKVPFVLLKEAMTLDGKIATFSGDSRWITGGVARGVVHQLRDTYDGIMVGIGTVLADDPELTTRLGNASKDPIRIIVDSKARIPLESKVLNLQSSEAATVIATTGEAPGEKINQLVAKGAKVLVCQRTQQGQVDLKDLLVRLGELEITSLLLEGGSTLAGAALENRIVDKVHWFIAPKIIGGAGAPGPIGGVGIPRMAEALHLKDIKVNFFGEDISIEGYI